MSGPALQAIRGYELRERIGAGGFGVVYRAYQPSVGREVAIKVILPEYANQAEFIRRFEAEAQLVARLEHLHIVPLYDYWREPDGAYLVMRWLRGGNLRESLQRGPWTPEAAARLLDQVASALSVAHRQGVVHRDIKPENILLDGEGNAYLSDFGIAKDLMRPSVTTETGAVIGSPAYMSPEHARGEPPTAQSDLYSLGVVMYQVLTGDHPFPGLTPAAQLIKHLTEPLPPLRERRPDLPEGLEEVIQRATAKSPAGRYPDALAFAVAFRKAASGPTAEDAARPLDWAALELMNPYKGLRPFEEADAVDFFGRESLTAQLLARMGEEGDPPSGSVQGATRFLAVVGPSGSGKSSVVKAGLLPALRRGALPDSDKWFVVEMVPGTHPLDELEIGLLRVAATQPAGLMEQLRRDERGLLRAARLALPGAESELLLVIDQFEELFTRAVDRAESEQFLQLLHAAVTEPRSRVRVILTLRADFYDRPLMHPDFSRLMRRRTEVVVPLTVEELTQAIQKPAEKAGVELEPGLVAAIVADVSEQPGALPMLQYALTELFERRVGRLLTQEAYRTIGGVMGALAQRAEELYLSLDADQQEAARQLLLRLVTLGEGTEDTRRRVLRTELVSLKVDPQAVEGVLGAFGRYRLLTFDRDPATRSPTVEVSHEALLREWRRLRQWLDESRDDLRLQRRLSAAAEEWVHADHDPSFLAHGSRLDQFEALAMTASLALTEDERAYLEASLADRAARRAQARRARNILRALQGFVGVAAVIAIVLAMVAFRARSTAQQERDNAQREAAINHSLVLAANAQNAQENGEVDLALALALEAVDMDQPPPESRRMLSAIALGPGTRAVLAGNSNLVRDVAISPDGKTALSGSCAELGSDGACTRGEMILWDLESRIELRHFEGHTGWVSAVAFSPDSKTALSGSGDTTLILWDMDTGQVIHRFEGHTGGVNSVAFGPEGQTALSGSDDATLILWDVTTGKDLRRLEGHTSGVNCVALSSDGQTALSGSDDTTLILWDVSTGEEIRRFEGHLSEVIDVVFTLDGRTILSSSGNTLHLWDLETGEEIRQQSFGSTVTWLVTNPDGRTMLVGGIGPDLRVWDIEHWQEVQTLLGARQAELIMVESAAISPDGLLALSGSSDGSLRLWNLAGQAEFHRFETDGTPRFAVAVSPDGRYLLTGDTADRAVLWDVERGKVIRHLEGDAGLVCPNCIAFSPDGKRALVGFSDAFGGSGAKSLVLWDIESSEEIRRFEGHRSILRSVALSPDGRLALSGSQGDYGNDLILWDVEAGEQIRRFDTDDDITSIAFSADGNLALTGSVFSSNLTLWDVATGQQIRRFEGPVDLVFDVAFGPDERTVLSASSDGSLTLWDVETGEIIRRYLGHDSWVWSLDVSPDGRYVISSSEDGVIILWDFETGEELRRFRGHTALVPGVIFSPDGQTAFSVSLDGELIEWQIADLPLEEMIEWTHANRYVRGLTCAERKTYRIEPLCEKQ